MCESRLPRSADFFRLRPCREYPSPVSLPEQTDERSVFPFVNIFQCHCHTVLAHPFVIEIGCALTGIILHVIQVPVVPQPDLIAQPAAALYSGKNIIHETFVLSPEIKDSPPLIQLLSTAENRCSRIPHDVTSGKHIFYFLSLCSLYLFRFRAIAFTTFKSHLPLREIKKKSVKWFSSLPLSTYATMSSSLSAVLR